MLIIIIIVRFSAFIGFIPQCQAGPLLVVMAYVLSDISHLKSVSYQGCKQQRSSQSVESASPNRHIVSINVRQETGTKLKNNYTKQN